MGLKTLIFVEIAGILLYEKKRTSGGLFRCRSFLIVLQYTKYTKYITSNLIIIIIILIITIVFIITVVFTIPIHFFLLLVVPLMFFMSDKVVKHIA